MAPQHEKCNSGQYNRPFPSPLDIDKHATTAPGQTQEQRKDWNVIQFWKNL